jgi:arabinogalactan oligomer / maltooligosaccharide transport system substrate-binding protein
MKNTKWTVLLVMLLMGALLLSACGGGEEPAPEPAPAEQPAEEVAPAPEEPAEEPMAEPTEEPMEEPTEEPMEEPTAEPVEETGLTLKVWADDTRTPALQSVAEQFQAEFGVTVVIEEIGFGDIRGLFTQAAPAGEGPDIIVGAHDWLGELVSSGLLAPIDLGDKLDDFAPAALQAFSYDGELYGMPNAQENVAFFINGDILDECPATWTEVKDISAEIAANNTDNIDSNLYGFVRMEGDPFHFFPIQTAFGGYVFGLNDDGSYNPDDVGVDSEGTIAAAQWWASMVDEGLQPPAVDWDTMHAWFEEGKAAMTITGPWALPRLRDSGVNYQICDIPDETADGRPFLGAQGFMVSAFSTDPLLAQIFLTEFVATVETMQAMYEADPRPPTFLPVAEALDDADIASFNEAGANALPMPSIPEMSAVWEAWGNAVVLVAQQGDTPENAFTNAADQIRSAIEGG